MKITEELVRGPWLRGKGVAAFADHLDDLRPRVETERGPVLVVEKDPVVFLAVFFAALLADRPVVLGNPGWGGGDGLANIESDLFSEELESGEILIPTGGSGGRLRFARHTWETLAASAKGFCRFFGGGPINSVCVLPLFHVSGMMQVVRALVTNGQVELVEWRELAAGELPVSTGGFLSLVPTQLSRLIEVESVLPWLCDLKAIPLGGAAAGGQLLERAARLRLPVVLSYGATETAAMATAQEPAEFLRGERTSGRALSHITVRVVGPSGEDLPAGTVGRVWVAGESLFNGYIPGGIREEPEWRSGDLGYLDREGRLVVVGREDRVVITGGEKVSPEEVERVLLKSGLVEDVCVLGLDDPEWGQAVAAAYVAEKPVGPEELIALVRSNLAAFKVPKLWLAVSELPRSAQGKIDRRRLETMFG